MEEKMNKTNFNLNSIADATSYLQKNFSKDMYFGEGQIGTIVEKMMEGKKLSQKDESILSSILPMSYAVCKCENKTLEAGECWNLSDSFKDANINLEIDTLTMKTGSSIVCRGKVLNLTINSLIKDHKDASAVNANYDIGIFGNDGGDGTNGENGANGPNGIRGRDGEVQSPGIAGPGATPGSDGSNGQAGRDGVSGQNGQSVLAASIKIKKISEAITILAKPGTGGNGGKGGDGGRGGNGGDGGNGITTGCEGNNGEIGRAHV